MPTSPTHRRFPNLPSTTYVSVEFTKTSDKGYGEEGDPEERHHYQAVRNRNNTHTQPGSEIGLIKAPRTATAAWKG